MIKQLHLLAHLSRWLEGERLELADLDGESVQRFFAARRAAGYTKLISVSAAEPMLSYLRRLGFIAERNRPCCTTRSRSCWSAISDIWCSSAACWRNRPMATR
jgi:hypothetical protein